MKGNKEFRSDLTGLAGTANGDGGDAVYSLLCMMIRRKKKEERDWQCLVLKAEVLCSDPLDRAVQGSSGVWK